MLSANCVLSTVYTILHVWINLILPQTLYIGYHYYLHFIDDENGRGVLKTVELLSLVGLVDLTPQSALLTSVEFSYSVVSNSLWTYGLQHVRFPCLSRTPGACSNSCPSSRWCHHPPSSPSPPAFNLSQHQDLIQWVSSLQQVAKVLEFQLQHQSFQWIFRTDLR